MSDSSSSKTEPPTPKKIRDSRKKGQVAKSKEVVSLFLLLSVSACFWLFSESMLIRIKALFDLPRRYAEMPLDQLIIPALFDALTGASLILAPILFVVFLMGIFSNIVQSGWIFSGEPVKPKITNIS